MRSRGPGRVASSAAALALLSCLGCRAPVLSGLNEAQANEVVVALDAAHIAASKRRDSSTGNDAYAVDVPAAEVSAALRTLQARALPRREPPGFDALEQSTGLVPTPAEERVRVANATAGELSRTLGRLAGVREARVHVAVPQAPRRLDDAPTAPKASVLLVREVRARTIDEARVRTLVAGAIDGLEESAVTIVQSESGSGIESLSTMVQVGPISVERRSARLLRALLGTTLGVNLALAVMLVVLIARQRRARG